jgi:ketosteroid isomerase-like protein
MTSQEIAARYMELYKQGRVQDIRGELYSADIVCTEPEHALTLGIPTITKGIAAVEAKSKERNEMIAEVHGAYCSEPVVAEKYFSVAMGRDVTFKNGPRMKFDEIAVFGISDGKIVTETFFY